MKVFVDAACDIHYSSFYILGLEQYFGKRVKFSNKYFNNFLHNNQFFSFVIVDRTETKKIVIDFADRNTVDKIAYDWCDVYGKINLENEAITIYPKAMAIGPGFGIKKYSLPKTLLLAGLNFAKSFKRIPNKRVFFSDYKAQYLRPALTDYDSPPTKGNFIFFTSSIWKNEPETNEYRANFINACLENDKVKFEGGFAPRKKNDVEGFEKITMQHRTAPEVYMQKTKVSVIAFNTPAVLSCHGWKLGEFLCMGKAIISTPLTRVMPVPIQENVHILFTSGDKKSIAEKIENIISNAEFKNKLEANAKQYFEKYLAPKAVIKRLIEQ